MDKDEEKRQNSQEATEGNKKRMVEKVEEVAEGLVKELEEEGEELLIW